ncbi:MAG: HD domain-containing protein [Lachnospiraceae bacterium]|nr:HD domain-containing protein [Lachnospiraceae bacterium]
MSGDISEKLQRYIDNTLRIRELSTPAVGDIGSAEDYRLVLLNAFRRIGDLAQENNRLLREAFFPLMKKEELLTEEELAPLIQFRKAQTNATRLENLDLSLLYLLAKRMCADAERRQDAEPYIYALDQMIESAFAVMHMTMRVYPVSELGLRYRDDGLADGEKLLAYLEPERFRALSDGAKELVLVNARYLSALFDRADALGDEKVNEKDLAFLRRALALKDDPFYKEQAPSYNWTYHTYRTLEYITQQVFNANERGFNAEQLSFIADCGEQLLALWKERQDETASYSTEAVVELDAARALYPAGRMDAEAYKDLLIRLYLTFDEEDYSVNNHSLFLMVPMELWSLSQREGVTKEDLAAMELYYRRMVSYIHRAPKRDSFSALLTYVSIILRLFTQTPGGMDFETFCRSMTVALHPPTYVHVKSVEDFTLCLTEALLERQPECFIGFLDCGSKEEVYAKKEEILEYAAHAALNHDIGKLFVTEVIMTYGRDLLQGEFELIKTHPLIGAYLLSRHEETKPYANVALMHHKWYDNTRGYPEDRSTEGMPERVMIEIVACADCLDASTDAVGRSYKAGKTLAEFAQELKEGAGTRYAPYLVPLFEDEAVLAKLQRILTEGRDENYREAYRILASYAAPEKHNSEKNSEKSA